MSYLGSIGQIRNGSGLSELWEMVYAKGSVVHMLTGHAFSRAFRANILAGAALMCVLLETPGCMDNVNKDHLRNLYTTLLDKEHNSAVNKDIAEEECIKKLTTITSQLLHQAAINSRTGKLWVQYMRQLLLPQLSFVLKGQGAGPSTYTV